MTAPHFKKYHFHYYSYFLLVRWLVLFIISFHSFIFPLLSRRNAECKSWLLAPNVVRTQARCETEKLSPSYLASGAFYRPGWHCLHVIVFRAPRNSKNKAFMLMHLVSLYSSRILWLGDLPSLKILPTRGCHDNHVCLTSLLLKKQPHLKQKSYSAISLVALHWKWHLYSWSQQTSSNSRNVLTFIFNLVSDDLF